MRSFRNEKIPSPRLNTSFVEAWTYPFVDVEIGAGQGLHAIRYAQAHPERALIAIERTHNRFAQLERRSKAHSDLENLFPVHADAVSVFVHQFSDHSVDRIFLLYPNPYPKPKQANIRWHNMPFMDCLKCKLKIGGELILATNIASYAEEAERQMLVEWRFQLRSKSVIDSSMLPRTHFEKKYLARGETCWNLVFVNAGQASIKPCS